MSDLFDLLDPELGVLDAASSDEAATADFGGSLDYIDNLNTGLSVSTGRRDALAIASALTPEDTQFLTQRLPARSVTDFTELSDSRLFHPLGDSAPTGVSRRSAADWVAPGQKEFEEQERRIRQIEHKAKRKLNWTDPSKQSLSALLFRDPDRNVICVRRKIRREVLAARHILGLTGFSNRKLKWFSRVFC